jgi:tetratricopeptide (TPR) repeat protein
LKTRLKEKDNRMRANRFFVVVILSVFVLSANFIFAADNAAVLNQVQELIKQKDYAAAKGLLAQRLKTDRNSYKLWLALGYVYESDNDYEQALKAFIRASELQTGIDGLATRIIRLQELVKSQPKKKIDSNSADAQGKARNLLINARYKHSFKEYLEAYQLFIQAVELDRSILARDYGFINNGLAYFKENANQPEIQFYLGAYNFYAGLYPKADDMLSDYIREYPKGQHSDTAKSLLQECRDIVAQAKAAEAAEIAALAAAEADRSRVASQEQNKTEDATQATADGAKPYVVAIETPEFATEQIYQEIPDGESLEIVEAKAKVIALLGEFDRETDSEKKYGILWRIGVIQQPFPEVIEKFSSLMAGGNIETIYATLEALDKIGLPGAENCVGDLYRLLDHRDVRVTFRAIQSFRRMPMQGARVIPKLFNIYQNEKHEIRKNLIVRTFQSYGEDGIAVLNAMVKAAPGDNKKPIAEIISILTGESVDDIINNS